MKSTTVIMVRNVLTVLGIVWSFASGVLIPKIRIAAYDIKVTSYNWSLLIGSLISVAFMFFALTIVATVLANQEHIIDRLIGMDPQNKERIETQVKSHIPSYSTKDRQNMDRPKVH